MSGENTTARWPDLAAFCSECLYSAVCPLTTLAEVENCAFVRNQRLIDIETRARGGDRLLAETPMLDGKTVVRQMGAGQRDTEPANSRRGRRPLDRMAVRRLVLALIEPDRAMN